ncbi:hypothetical protein [Fredinandcohnia quinoae]|uniref:Uncharacterized protein n=1 Tax=Fredinandcohnia quinoae TaxID=2918902 RepID=A0AAW5DXQ5_9BACI|nr:hypothetical protein [Fredinandcohnia sp. SECRCQ15]MCH1624089.1 hypothetical protein [Fredinandcohnia sp. SECRCQ15]
MAVFWPIMLFGGILLCLYFIQKNAHFNGLKIVLGLYGAILLISVIVYYALPNDRFIADNIPQTKINQEEQSGVFYDTLFSGSIEKLEDVDKINEWNFSYDHDELNIAPLDNLNLFTIFERKESDDGQIDIVYYATNTNVYGIDFSKITPLPKISLEDERINIFYNDENRNEFVISAFHNDFVLAQFKGGGVEDDFNYDYMERPLDSQAIYIKIPKNLKLTGSEYPNIVGED